MVRHQMVGAYHQSDVMRHIFPCWACLFWVSAAGLFYTFLGYPILIFVLAKLFPRRTNRPDDTGKPPLETCVVLIAFNEERRIAGRLRNLLASNQPRLRILVVSDGSTDATVDRIMELREERVDCVARAERVGKSACLNIAVAQAKADCIVFADARQRFESDAIEKLVSNFSNPEVGAVSGILEVDASSSSMGEGVDAYWKLEKFVRKNESVFDSCIGCTGAVYAIRRELFTPIPDDTILDDVVIPMGIAQRGWRVIYDTSAVAFDPQSLEPAAEKIRKKRTLAGNFQMLFRHPGWLLPWRNRLWWQLISHKILRLAAPAGMLCAFASNAMLCGSAFYRALFFLHGLFYFFAGLGMTIPRLKHPLFSWPAGFVFLNAMTVRGFFHFLTASNRKGWESRRPS
jgi:cellulose synthase/poly-beta-1,6-N-acetylglucosamine synthase-like glycosyltransferase